MPLINLLQMKQIPEISYKQVVEPPKNNSQLRLYVWGKVVMCNFNGKEYWRIEHLEKHISILTHQPLDRLGGELVRNPEKEEVCVN